MRGEAIRRRLARAWMAIVLATVLHNGWMWIVQRRTPETDLLALLPMDERDPAVGRAVANVADAAQQYFVVLIGSSDWNRARTAAAAYAHVLDLHREWFGPVDAGALNSDAAIAPWWSHRSALLTADDRRMLQSGTSERWVNAAMQNLTSPLGTGRLGAWQDDPFGIFRDWLQARASDTPVRPVDGLLRADDGSMHYAVLPMHLRGQAFAFFAQQAVIPLLHEAEAAARRAAPGVRLLSAGVILPAAAAARQADHEMSTIGWGSLLGIVLLVWLALRSFRPIGLVLLSLGVGTVGALSVTALIYPKVHLITLVFGASLVGTAADYGLNYLCARVGDNRDPWVVMRTLLPGLAFGVVTTVVAYLGLAMTPFPGLRQMAVFAAFGLIFAWITVVLWFPSLGGAAFQPSRLALWFGGTRARWPVASGTMATTVVGLAAAVVLAIGIARLKPNDDIRLLQNSPPGMIEEQSEVGRVLRAPSLTQFYVVRAESDSGLLAREETLRVRLDSLVGQGIIEGYQAVSSWVPSAETQARDQALIAGRLYGASGALDRLAGALGEDGTWAEKTRARLSAPAAPLTVKDWLASSISEPYRHLWLGEAGGEWASVVSLQGIDYAMLSHVAAAAAGITGVRFVDKVADISALLGRYRREMGWVIACSYVAIFLLLLPRYGRRAWRVLAPSVVASVVALAFFGLIGQPLQLFHVLALLIIFGSGVDYAIFLIERPDSREGNAWLGVALSAMSTLLSFGLLSSSGTPVLRAFGLTMLVGITVSMIASPYFCSDRWRAG
jgi:predicted exporter